MNADMRAAPAALVCTAQCAREIAVQTGTPLSVAQNGKVVEKTITFAMIAPIADKESH
ncbi:MAG: hypothetical protein WAX67_00805 [Rugosibacter sp.]